MIPKNSLWPEDIGSTPDPRSPNTILREQAAALAPLTQRKILAIVVAGSQGEWVTLDFTLVAPGLNDYHYRLFKVRHKVHPQYPAQILWDKNLRAENENELRQHLASIFRDRTTQRVLGDLMTLSVPSEEHEESAGEPELP